MHFAYDADNTCVFGVQYGVFSFVCHDSSTPISFMYDMRSSMRYSLLKVCRTSYDGTMYPYRIPKLFSRFCKRIANIDYSLILSSFLSLFHKLRNFVSIFSGIYLPQIAEFRNCLLSLHKIKMLWAST